MQVLSIVVPWKSETELRLCLSAVTVIDLLQIRLYRLPPLLKSGVRYRGETCLAPNVPETCERFLTALQCYRERFGDCDDLAPWWAAECIINGDLRARAFPIRSSVGWHCLVRRGNGDIDDPSAWLGMKGSV